MEENKKHIRASFFLDLFLKEKSFPPFYKKITNAFLNKNVYLNLNSYKNLNISTYTVFDIPDYFITEIDNSGLLKMLTAPLYLGYIIDLTNFKNLEDYLTTHLGKPRKSQIKRYKKRLDLCIAPNYKTYYGAIEKEAYHFIFNELKILTKRRFDQKEELNFELPFLELYENIMYPLILNKKASIFVIFDKNKPINISLNFIDDTTIFHWNSCYDIDYQMFNLGHINMINHLDWAYKNGFKLFDMGRGDFLHKRKYVNKSYMYRQQVFFNTKSISATIKAGLEILKLKVRFGLIKILKKANLHLWYVKYAKFKYLRATSSNEKVVKKQFEIDFNISEIPKLDKLKCIDINNKETAFLIYPFNDYLHKSQEFIDNTQVFIDKIDNKTYYFKGFKKQQKLTVKN
jgi:hypothetical protein